MIEINLVPDVKLELLRAQRVRMLVISISIITMIAAGAVTVLLALFVFGAQGVLLAGADGAIKEQGNKLAAVEDLSKILTIQNQVQKISETHGSKNITSRIFDALTATNPPSPNNIKVSTITINTEETTIKIDGQAEGGYRALETYKKTINATQFVYVPDGDTEPVTVPLVSDVTFDNVGYGRDVSGKRVLSFSVTFTYAPELFAVDSDNAKIGDLKWTNVTDSYTDVPESLFTSKASPIEENK